MTNWYLIKSDETFEYLVGLILKFEDAQAKWFGRAGKDWGQDILSGDKKTVYQVKHHAPVAKISNANADLEKELQKLDDAYNPDDEEYSESNNIKRRKYWEEVKNYILIENLYINPKDNDEFEKKRKELVQGFTHLPKLNIELWTLEDLEKLLTKYPNIVVAFFEGKNRLFHTIPEVINMKRSQENYEHNFSVEFQGRTTEISNAIAFLDVPDKFIFLIDGPGGIGKTRFMIEVGKQVAETKNEWLVLWCNTESLKQASNWFSTIPFNQKILFLLDEPDHHIVSTFLEQSNDKRIIKLLVTTRSSDTLQQELKPIRRMVQKQTLNTLSAENAIAVVENLLDKYELPQERINIIAEKIASRYDYYPGWITIATELFNNEDELPATKEDLAETYLNEIYNNIDCDSARTILLWMAFERKLHYELERNEFLEIYGESVNAETWETCIEQLVNAKIVQVRGKERKTLRIKPDIIADHILMQKLIKRIGNVVEPSNFAKKIVKILFENISKIKYRYKTLLVSLARIQYIAKVEYNKDVKLVDEFVTQVHEAISDWVPKMQIATLNAFMIIAPLYPDKIIEIVQIIMYYPTDKVSKSETLWGYNEITATDVIMEIPWLLFHILPYIKEKKKKEVLELYCKLAQKEIQYYGNRIPNDGKRAVRLLPRIVGREESNIYYADAAYQLANEILNDLQENGSHEFWPDMTKYLFYPLLKIETFEFSSNRNSLSYTKSLLRSDSALWKNMIEFIKRIQKLLSELQSTKDRVELLQILIVTQRESNRAVSIIRKKDTKLNINDYIELQKMNLQWVIEYLQNPDLQIQEITKAREIWAWNLRYEQESSIKKIAEQCEEQFNKLTSNYTIYNKLYKEREDYKTREALAKQKGKELSSENFSSIEQFVKNGIEYLGEKQFNSYQSRIIAVTIGENMDRDLLPELNKRLSEFTDEDKYSAQFDFYSYLCQGWLKRQHENSTDDLKHMLNSLKPQLHALFISVVAHSISIDGLNYIMQHVYNYFKYLSDTELQEKQNIDILLYTRILSRNACDNWELFTKIMDEILDRIYKLKNLDLHTNIITSIIEYIRNHGTQPNDKQIAWLTDQLIKLPDIRDRILYPFTEFTKKRMSVCCIVHAIPIRIEYYNYWKAVNEYGFNTIPYYEFTEFVKSVEESEKTCFTELFQLLINKPTLRYGLAEIIAKLDPTAEFLIANIAKLKLNPLTDENTFITIAQIIGNYEENSPAWRLAAKELLQQTKYLPESKKIPIIHWMKGNFRSYAGPSNEVAPFFYEQVNFIKEQKAIEEDELFIPYWEYRLKETERELQYEIDRLEEEKE